MSDSADVHATGPDTVPALQHLTQLQHQLTALRSLLPATVTPFLTSTNNPSPEALYTQFAMSAASALGTIRTFRAAWEDEETGRVLKQVRASLAKSGREGVGGRWWDSEMAGQASEEKHDLTDEMDKVQLQNATEVEGREGKGMAESDAQDVLEAFRKRRPDCTVEYRSLDEAIKVWVSSDLQRLNFNVHAVENISNCIEYKVVVVGNSKLLDSIIRCLDSRPHKTDLVYTLNSIAAYSDLGSKKCDKCKRLLDSTALVPTWRRRPLLKDQQDEGTGWEALHEGCQG